MGDNLGEKGRLGRGKADTPSNTGTHLRRWTHHPTQAHMTRPPEGGHTIQYRHACGETRGDKTSGSAYHPTKGNKKLYNRRQREKRHSLRRTHHPTRGNKKG